MAGQEKNTHRTPEDEPPHLLATKAGQERQELLQISLLQECTGLIRSGAEGGGLARNWLRPPEHLKQRPPLLWLLRAAREPQPPDLHQQRGQRHEKQTS
jgi:hypothetical protein